MDLAHAYAKVLHEAERQGLGADFTKKLAAFMKSRGHLSLVPQILRILAREPEDAVTPVVLVAKEPDARKFSSAIRESLAALGAEGKHETRVDPRAVGGFAVRTGSRSIDRSFRSALVSLYRRALT